MERLDEQKEDRPKTNKKKVAITIISTIFFVGMIVLAVALTAVNTSFVKTIHVSPQVLVTILGDTGDTTISCIDGGSCSSNEITLINNDNTASHDCTVTTSSNDNITVSYSGIPSNGQVSLDAGTNVTFKVNYNADAPNGGNFQMTTNINCPV